jgi:sugar phosphate isomerase/epimerase
MTRRDLIGTLAAAPAALAQGRKRGMWKPRLGLLTRFNEANIEFARREGFTCVQLSVDATLAGDEAAERVRAVLARSGLHLSSLMAAANHTDPDPEARRRVNESFARTIELAGRLGVRYVGTSSGNMPGRKFAEQVDEVVRVYTEKYFPLCQKHNVVILWEPWAGGPNIATGPVGYEALFKAFGDSPYVGLLYDPSHLVWQMMDPIQCARDFVDKIHDVHLKDTEIHWEVVRRAGIQPVNHARWWRFRLPGFGDMDWKAFFNVLAAAGYQGDMNIEHEDELYGWPPPADGRFTPEIEAGFRVCREYLKQYVPV